MGRSRDVRDGVNEILQLFVEQALTAFPDDEVALLPCRPLVPPAELPALYTFWGDSTADYPDFGRIRDSKVLVVRLVVQPTDSDEHEQLLDDLGDLLEDVLDVELRSKTTPLRDLTETMDRTGRRERVLDFNGVLLLCHEFPVRARLRGRQLGPA